MKSKKIGLVLAVTVGCIFGNVTGVMAESNETDYIKDVSYLEDEGDNHKLDIHGVSEDGEKKPVIVEVHGGAYIGGMKELNTAHSEFYADNGFAVVNTNYTTMKQSGFKEVVQDLNSVLNWVETNADEYGFDTDHVFMSGDSAGGYFVTLMATVLNSEELQEYYGIEVPDYDVKGYVLTCPGSNIRALADALNSAGEGMSANIAQQIGAEVLGDEDIVNHADLYSIIDAETFPSVHIITTPEDTTLYGETKAFHEFLEEQGINHEYVEYENEENQLEHVFNVGHTDWKESIEANTDAVNYMKALCE